MLLEQIIFSNLVYNEEYARKVVPFLKSEYFSDNVDKTIYELINAYFIKYNVTPSIEALAIDLSNTSSLNEEAFKSATTILSTLSVDNTTSIKWLLEQTEKFCQEKSIYNAIMKSIQIIDDKNNLETKGAIPQILSDALAISFDNHIGHDFFEDSDIRFESYHNKQNKIPFDISLLNEVTEGGLANKTLNICLAGTNVGKSMFMCHCATNNLRDGKNVLYITLEMAEEQIAKRIDANLLNIPLSEMITIPKEMYDRKIEKVKSKTVGKLIVKEYPTSCAGTSHFRHLLNELKIKKNFIPDIIYIDYLNICMSSRIKPGANVNSYTYIKAIAEELRGLAVEFNLPIVSATQTTRTGFSSSDVSLEDTSESFGLPATADFMFALISSEELEELNQIMFKQLKNRGSSVASNRRFVIGMDRAKMRLYDVEQSGQDDVMSDSKKSSDKSVFDNSSFGDADSERKKPAKFKTKFLDFK